MFKIENVFHRGVYVSKEYGRFAVILLTSQEAMSGEARNARKAKAILKRSGREEAVMRGKSSERSRRREAKWSEGRDGRPSSTVRKTTDISEIDAMK